jgi:hypothetical protein
MAQTTHLASFGPTGKAMASLRSLPIVFVGVAQGWDGDGKPTWLAYCCCGCGTRLGQRWQAYVACPLCHFVCVGQGSSSGNKPM